MLIIDGLLLGCSHPDPVEPDTGAASTRSDAWSPPAPTCWLGSPLTIDPASPPTFSDVNGLDYIFLVSLAGDFDYYAENLGCPTQTSDEAGGTTWDGDCDLPELTWEGSWREGPVTRAGRTYEEESPTNLRYADNFFTGYSVEADGTVLADCCYGTGSVRMDLTMNVRYNLDHWNGDWIQVTDETWDGGGSYAFTGDITYTSPEGVTAEWCAVVDTTTVSYCDLEPYGGWVLQGDRTMVVTFDPATACDGCGDVTIDGVSVGRQCGETNGLW